MRRWVAAALASALVWGVPGLDFYAALAQVVAAPVEGPAAGIPGAAGGIVGSGPAGRLDAGGPYLGDLGALKLGPSGARPAPAPALGAAPAANQRSLPLPVLGVSAFRIGGWAGPAAAREGSSALPAARHAAKVGMVHAGAAVAAPLIGGPLALSAPSEGETRRRSGRSAPSGLIRRVSALAEPDDAARGLSLGDAKARQDACYDRSGIRPDGRADGIATAVEAPASGISPAAEHRSSPENFALRPPAARAVDEEKGPAAETVPPQVPAAKSGDAKLPRSLWGLFWGHEILTVFGINFHMLSQPFLVLKTLGKSKAIMGLVRNVHMGSMSVVNLLPVGLLIDKTDFRTLFVATSLARAVLMGAIPILFLAGHLTFGILVAIVALNPIFQSTMVTADTAARNAFLGKDEKLNKEAAAVIGKYAALGDMVFPLVAGYVLGALVAHFGLGGYALAYGIYAGLLLASIPFYWFMVRDPRNPSEMGWKGFKEFMRLTGTFLWALAKGLALAPAHLAKAAWGWISRRLRASRPGHADPSTAPGGAAGESSGADSGAHSADRPGLLERIARSLDRHEAMHGLAYILRNRVLRVLIFAGSIEAFLSDAMPMVVLPNYITDVIGEPAHAVPFLGALLGTAGGVFGMMLAAEQLGHFISSWYMQGDRGDRAMKKFGTGRFYRAAAVSSLLFWLMWLFPAVVAPHAFFINFAVVMAVQLLTALAHGPVGVVMAPVTRKEIPDDKLGRVESAFNMVDLFFSAGGALAAGFLLDLVGIKTAMFLIALAVTGTGVMEWMIPKWIFNKPAGGPAPNPAPSASSGAGASGIPAAPGNPAATGSPTGPTPQNPPPSKDSSEGGKTARLGTLPRAFAPVYA